MGAQSGKNTQGNNAVAIGNASGQESQGAGAIAIGYTAGQTFQGADAIAIGRNAVNATQAAGSIAINASGTSISATQIGYYVAPIRNDDTQTQAICYNTTTKEVTYATTGTKTFIIQHPIDENKYLVHGCLEGPEAGVYYRGEGKIIHDTTNIEINLPDYVQHIAHAFTVHLTPIYEEDTNISISSLHYVSSRINDGSFKVYGPPGSFYWIVHGTRNDIAVEPLKTAVAVKGDGPYKWI